MSAVRDTEHSPHGPSRIVLPSRPAVAIDVPAPLAELSVQRFDRGASVPCSLAQAICVRGGFRLSLRERPVAALVHVGARGLGLRAADLHPVHADDEAELAARWARAEVLYVIAPATGAACPDLVAAVVAFVAATTQGSVLHDVPLPYGRTSDARPAHARRGLDPADIRGPERGTSAAVGLACPTWRRDR